MDLRATARMAWPPQVVLDQVADLGTYPGWLGIVRRARPDGPLRADPGPAWVVEMGAGAGPFRVTKRVRMTRSALSAGGARFERAEADGAEHSPWVLTAGVRAAPAEPRPGAEAGPEGPRAPDPAGTWLTMDLHYGGSARVPFLEAILAAEVGRAASRLEARLARLGPGRV